jgi:hypothetical protein
MHPAVRTQAPPVLHPDRLPAVELLVVLLAEQDGVVEARRAAPAPRVGVVRDEPITRSAVAAGPLAPAPVSTRLIRRSCGLSVRSV